MAMAPVPAPATAMTSSPTREEVEWLADAIVFGPPDCIAETVQDAAAALRALLARAEAAERERDNWKRRAEDMHRRVTAAEGCAYNRWMRDQRDAARAEAARLREGLQFYADPANWRDTPSWDGDPDCITPKAIPVDRSQDGSPCDCGDRARAALAGEAGRHG